MGRAQHQLDVTAAALPGAHTFQSDVRDPAAIALLKERSIDYEVATASSSAQRGSSWTINLSKTETSVLERS